MTTPCPVVFLGSPSAAVTVLDALVEAGHRIPLVITQPDARRGRGGATSPTVVRQQASALGLETVDSLDALSGRALPEGTVGVVVAYGRIIPAWVLGLMPFLNVHFSLLPRWRGAAPVERAILAGDTETGVCIMDVEEGLDTGGVRTSRRTGIGKDETARDLTARLAVAGAELLCGVLAAPLGPSEPQEGEVTYARKITREDLEIDWAAPASDILRKVRAVPARTRLGERQVGVVSATGAEGEGEPGLLTADGVVGTGRGCVRLCRVRPAGSQEMAAQDWLRGMRVGFPVRLGGEES